MAKASAEVAITAPRPTATTTSWVQKPRIRPKVAKQPRAKPWLSEALITAIAPGPGREADRPRGDEEGEPERQRHRPDFARGDRRDNRPMAKEKSIYSCTECGATSPKWLGKCPGCGAWNTLVESVAESVAKPRYAPGARPAAGRGGGDARRDRRHRRRAPSDRHRGVRPRARRRHRRRRRRPDRRRPGDRQVDPAAAGARRAGALDEGALRHRRGERRAGRAALAPARPRREPGARARRDPAREDPGDARGRAAGGRA